MDLESYRKALAITKAEAARQLGVRWATYNDWEKGAGSPSLEAFGAIHEWSEGQVTLEAMLAVKSDAAHASTVSPTEAVGECK